MKPMPTGPFWFLIYFILGALMGLFVAHIRASSNIRSFYFGTITVAIFAPFVLSWIFPRDDRRVYATLFISMAVSSIIGKIFGV